jgi:5,10-methylene-tetrahydrofolate dehydrogenase/methenyl tetrahydrofolate cyclohydrolase
MALTQEQIEWLHDNGKMPDWAYFQQNGKTAQQNYVEATRRARERIMKNYEAQ